MRTLARALTCAAVLAALSVAPAPAGADALPVRYSFPEGVAVGLAHPDASPPGANDWSCRPSAAHPRPVVLVHGTVENMAMNWNALSPLLRNDGFCVFALNYGQRVLGAFRGLDDVAGSAAELAAFVDRVLAATGATKVDLVGHSQGGMMPRYYINVLGGAAEVGTLVGLAPSNHGTTFLGLGTLATLIPGAPDLLEAACDACRDQLVGSPFLQRLNGSGETRPGVRYTVIATVYDEVVTPYWSAFLTAGPGATVRNITLQSGCWIDGAEHVSISYDRRALALTRNALDPANPRPVPCTASVPLVGG